MLYPAAHAEYVRRFVAWVCMCVCVYQTQILIFVDKNHAQSAVVIVKIILSHRCVRRWTVIAVIIVTALVPGDSIITVHVNIADITMQLPIVVLK